jgi:membrane-bound lytic murein transglycosylase B
MGTRRRHRRGRRIRSSIAAGLTVVLVPFAATASAPTVTSEQESALLEMLGPTEGVVYTMASRSGARAALLDHVDPETFLAGLRAARGDGVAVSSPKGTRLWTVSALSDHNLPEAAKRAYRRAAAQMATADPGCGLRWTLLAAIGRVESDHGRYGGARLGNDGVSRPRIIGIQLDGKGPVAAIRDTDGGRLDGDKVWDRAVGPMQFIPSTWEFAARDGDGDGRKSPHDLDDAAAAAATYLCSGSGSLLDPGTQAAAIYRYNQDDYYVALVQAFEVGYRTGTFVIPSPPSDDDETEKRRKKRRDRDKATTVRTSEGAKSKAPKKKPATTSTTKTAKTTATTAPKPSPTKTSKPQPTASTGAKPTPSPAPASSPAPTPTSVTGALTVSGGTYSLAGKPLDLGIVGQLEEKAVGDFDKSGATESNQAELDGLLAMEAVTMVLVKLESGKFGIYSINGIPLA